MNILVTGKGGNGSWAIRGEQMGRALGAVVQPMAIDVAAYDVAIVVKRTPGDLISRIRRAGVPLVYDMVDAWPQPEGNHWGRELCMAWLRSKIEEVKPSAIVAATNAMAADCAEFGVPVICIPHHCRPGIQINPIREHVRTVGYEGAEHYLGRWKPMLESECRRRGWSFVVNPVNLAEVDIVVALRDAEGYAARHWKSGVKLSNAQGSGTPFIGGREAGYVEQAVGSAEKWADTDLGLVRSLDALTPWQERKRAAGWMLSAAPRLDAWAKVYKTWLKSVCSQLGK